VGDHTSYDFSVCEKLLKPLGTLGLPLALMIYEAKNSVTFNSKKPKDTTMDNSQETTDLITSEILL
jgi:hypothetical protein